MDDDLGLGDVEVAIPCECGLQIKKTLGWLEAHPEFSCTECGLTIRLNSEEITSLRESVRKSVSDFQQALDALNRRLEL